ncbi:MAG: hypothetical protein R3C02_13655 [Planctomycetaceae bacterium]
MRPSLRLASGGRDELHARPEFVTPQQIREERAEFLQVLVEELQTLAYRALGRTARWAWSG